MKNCFPFVLFLFIAATLRPCMAQGPVVYPSETKSMTDAQFYQWATTTNARLKAEWEARKERAKADQPQYLQGTVAKTSVGYSYGRNGGLGRALRRPWRLLRQLHVYGAVLPVRV